jgi:hypothetical protein
MTPPGDGESVEKINRGDYIFIVPVGQFGCSENTESGQIQTYRNYSRGITNSLD